MCVLFIAWKSHPRYRLVLAGNRDEFRARPAAPLARWSQHPDVAGGRDLKAGGSWLAATATGRFAAVTNFRQVPLTAGRHSRGALVSDFVCGADTPAAFVRKLAINGADYGGTNLFTGDHDSLWHWSNRGEVTQLMAPGLYGLSNGMLEDDWPKMRRGRAALLRLIAADTLDEEALFAVLTDRTPAADHELPDTGVGRDMERALSSIFIAGDNGTSLDLPNAYGTRASTLLLIGHDGRVRMREKRWGAGGKSEGESSLTL